MADSEPETGAQPVADRPGEPPAVSECCCPQVFMFIFADKVINKCPQPPKANVLVLLLLLLLLLQPCPAFICRRPEKDPCRKTKRRCH